ncbi:MAG: Eco57I restriction-modification methylase domain-containing protein [Candidatus Aenigmatarchaeota archaeon]
MSNKIGFVETPLEIANLMIELSNIDRNALVLDTGCGKGVFLQALENKGYKNVYGVEIDGELYEYCDGRYGEKFKIIRGDFLTFTFNRKFDLIIGNPPYVHFNRIPPEIADNVREMVKTSEGDIYYAFIIKSISLLKEGGELIYIVPYHFFYNTYAKFVRDVLLQSGKIEVIIDLDETRLFNNENPEVVIFKFKKGKYDLKNEEIKLLKVKTVNTNSLEIYEKAIKSLSEEASNDIFDYVKIPHYLNSESWSTFVINIPNFPSVKMKDIAKVGVGLVSGFDEAFTLDEEKADVRLKFNDGEINLVKRFVKGKYCKRFIVDGSGLYILIDDCVRNEKELELMYPNIYKKILPFKDIMSKRYLPKKKEWFHWQALRNYKFLISNLNKKRIYVPTLDRRPYNRFSLGEEGLLPSGDVLFIQPYNDEDLYFLLGYLNTSFFRKYYLGKGGRRGGRISFTQRLLENVEIPLFPKEIKEKIIHTTKEIISKLKEGNDTSPLEKELDDLVYSAIVSL